MISPILYLAGGAVLIGGVWYVASKWTASSKCLDKATLAAVVESILHGDKTSADARKLADALEKDGCAAADVKSIRDAATARDAKACPPATHAETIAKVATMTFEDVSRVADEWATAGCATEAKALKDAFAAALKKVALPLKMKKPGDFVPDPTPPPGDESKPIEGWPKVQELPSEAYAKVYPAVSKIRWNALWSVEPPTSITDVCPWGCSSASLIDAWKALDVSPLGGLDGLTEAARDAAVTELKTAHARLVTKEPSTGGTSGYASDYHARGRLRAAA